MRERENEKETPRARRQYRQEKNDVKSSKKSDIDEAKKTGLGFLDIIY